MSYQERYISFKEQGVWGEALVVVYGNPYEREAGNFGAGRELPQQRVVMYAVGVSNEGLEVKPYLPNIGEFEHLEQTFRNDPDLLAILEETVRGVAEIPKPYEKASTIVIPLMGDDQALTKRQREILSLWQFCRNPEGYSDKVHLQEMQARLAENIDKEYRDYLSRIAQPGDDAIPWSV